jgi:hypothetical protein
VGRSQGRGLTRDCPSVPSPRSQGVDFAGFVRVLAHFRPVDDEEIGNRDPKQPEPLNSRMNKLCCEFVGTCPSKARIYPLQGEARQPPTPLCDFPPLQGGLLGEGNREESPSFVPTLFPVAFQLYDLDRDGMISRLELLQVGRMGCHKGGVTQSRAVGTGWGEVGKVWGQDSSLCTSSLWLSLPFLWKANSGLL